MISGRAWRKNNPNKVAALYAAAREQYSTDASLRKKKRARNKAWCAENRNNPEYRAKRRAWAREWRDKNREKLNKQARRYRRERRKIDRNFLLQCSLRNRLWGAISGNFKSGSAVRDLGCTIPELKAHLESQFHPGMSWDNWTREGWHLDHIIPLASFDLTDRAQLKEACHYSNLQPLWASDNLSKNAKPLTTLIQAP